MSDRDQRFAEQTDESSYVIPEEEHVPESHTDIPVQEKVSLYQHVDRMKNRIHRLHLFASFCEHPSNVSFQTQEEDEHVLLFLRKSQWVNFPWIFGTALLAIIPLFIYYFQGFFIHLIPSLSVLLILIPLYYLFVITYGFINFVTWYYNAALITDKRVVDVDFHQIVLKDVAETKLALVQDVSYKQDGVLPNMFGYGFVLIQTAGTLENFEFHNLPQPARVVEIVEALIGGRRYEP